ncbi:MAG: MAE_28990/MAE_18760 family HEPN-like nuclease, partial [Alphaproteobacteria bacterium]
GRLDTLAASKQALASAEALGFIQKRLGDNASFNLENAIDTESNLSSSVFQNILRSIGLNDDHYSPYYNLIDESLLKRRNKVAHGEYLDLNAREWRDIADTVVSLMRAFKTDIQNAAILASYRAV